MNKAIAFTVVPAHRLSQAALLMQSVKKHMPGVSLQVIVLDTPTQEVESTYSFNLKHSESLWGQEFLDKAFFYSEEDFCRLTEFKVVTSYLEDYETCIMLDSQVLLLQNFTRVLEQVSEDTILSFAAPALYRDNPPAPAEKVTRMETTLGCMRVFCRGKGLSSFFSWVEKEFEKRYIAGIPGFRLPGGEYDSRGDFYTAWPRYAPLFGCKTPVLPLPCAAWPFTGPYAGEFAVLADFTRPPLTENLRASPTLAKLYTAWQAGIEQQLNAHYKYDFFEDGTKIFSFLKLYYALNYRLKTACERNPFAHSALFTERTVVLGEEKGIPFTPAMAALYHFREDLQKAFPTARGSQREAYAEWFLQYGAQEYSLSDAYTKKLRALLDIQRREDTLRDEKNRRISVRLRRRLGFERQLPQSKRPSGINLAGYIRGDFGLGEACRILADIFHSQSIPLAITEIAQPQIHSYNNTRWASAITNTFPYNINMLYTNADGLDAFLESISSQALAGRYNIGYWSWELPEFPDEWRHFFDSLDEIWTLSEFAAGAIRAKTEKPVFVLPHSVVVGEEDKSLTRKDFGLEEENFVFLMMYDVNSVMQRKNPQGALQAFQRAFGERRDVTLLIKTNMSTGKGGAEDLAFLEQARLLPNVKILTSLLPRRALNSLLSLCDAFVSLHRSEGFGLGPAEAMYLGRPSVITGWSGNMEYSTPDVCYLVKYSLVKIDRDYGPYRKGMTWAEPNIEDAARGMLKMAEDKEYYQRLSQNGAARMRREFSPKRLGEKAKARFLQLGLLPDNNL